MAGDQRIILGKNKAGDSSGLYVTKSGLDYFGNDPNGLPVATTANDLLFDSDLAGQSIQVYQRGTFDIVCEQITIPDEHIRAGKEKADKKESGDLNIYVEQWMIDLFGPDNQMAFSPYNIDTPEEADPSINPQLYYNPTIFTKSVGDLLFTVPERMTHRNLDTGSAVIDISNSNIPPGTKPEIAIRFAVGNSQTGEIHPWYAKNTGADAAGTAGLYSSDLGGNYAPSHPNKIERMDSAWHRFKYDGSVMTSSNGSFWFNGEWEDEVRETAWNSNIGAVGVMYFATDNTLIVNAFMTPTYTMNSRKTWDDIRGKNPAETTTSSEFPSEVALQRQLGGFPRSELGWHDGSLSSYHPQSFFNPFSDNKTGRVTPHPGLSLESPISWEDNDPAGLMSAFFFAPAGKPIDPVQSQALDQLMTYQGFNLTPDVSAGTLIGPDEVLTNLDPIPPDEFHAWNFWLESAALNATTIPGRGQNPGDPLYNQVLSAQTFFTTHQTVPLTSPNASSFLDFLALFNLGFKTLYPRLSNVDAGDDEIGLLGAGSLASLNGGTANLQSMIAAGDTPNNGWDTYHCSYMVYSFGVAETAPSETLAEATYNINFDKTTLQNSSKRTDTWEHLNDGDLGSVTGYGGGTEGTTSGEWGHTWLNYGAHTEIPYYRNLVFPDDFVGTIGDPATDPFHDRRNGELIVGNVHLNITTMGRFNQPHPAITPAPGDPPLELALYGSDEWDSTYHRPKPAITFDFSSDKWDLENNPTITLFIDNYGYIFGGGGAGGFGGRVNLSTPGEKGGSPFFDTFAWYPGGGGGGGAGSGGNPAYHVGGTTSGVRTYEGVGFGGKGYGFHYTEAGPPTFVEAPPIGGDGERRRGYDTSGNDPATGGAASTIAAPTFYDVNGFDFTPGGGAIHTGSDGGDAIGIIVDPTNNESGNITVEIHNTMGLISGGGGGGGGGKGGNQSDGLAGNGGRLGDHGQEGYSPTNDPTLPNPPIPPYDEWPQSGTRKLNLFAFGGNPGYVIASPDRNWLGETQLQTTWQRGLQDNVFDLGNMPYVGMIMGREPNEQAVTPHDPLNSGGRDGAAYRIGRSDGPGQSNFSHSINKTRFTLGHNFLKYWPSGTPNNGTDTATYKIVKP